jgi:hypothetical protein
MRGKFKVGDKVRLKNHAEICHLKHRKNQNAIITNIDGAYILIRPMWCKWLAEVYPNEIEEVI